MKAARYDRFGSARDVLEVGEIDTPSARPGEVLVRLKTSGVNPSDVKKRAGSFPDLLDDGPVIPNSDGAGIVEAVGDGVPESRVGAGSTVCRFGGTQRRGRSSGGGNAATSGRGVGTVAEAF